MCVSQCSRCVGFTLVPLAIICMLANALLLFPDLQTKYLLEGHLTSEARWSTGIWASGVLVLVAARVFVSSASKKGFCGFRTAMICQVGYTCVALAAAGFCFLTSGKGLYKGPQCLYNSTQGPVWGTPHWQMSSSAPRSERLYIYEPDHWASTCIEPRRVVLWNVSLFTILMVASGIQAVLCAVNIINSLLGVLCGPSFGINKVTPA
ncbi:transmembrane 4 L6 family member 1 [Alosa sapidissima]|uniref:transmembrane 4 L6 family member 1 n=1 Tax=Alosa sapidissima TaxID=34773 RepID=UPI001C09E94C|nr:transmembrane 4 L6 family member 1 [Alosa sapidissima]